MKVSEKSIQADASADASFEKFNSASEWLPVDTLPPPGYRLGNVWVIVEGWEEHSGSTWYRRRAGLARTDNDGFYQEDIRLIEDRDHMERGSGRVTHWMPIILPPYPSRATAPDAELNFSNESGSDAVSLNQEASTLAKEQEQSDAHLR